MKMRTEFISHGAYDCKTVNKDEHSGYDGKRLDQLYASGVLNSRKDCEDMIRVLEVHKYCFNKEDVPQGIVAFKNRYGDVFTLESVRKSYEDAGQKGPDYEDWVRHVLYRSSVKSIIYTISTNGQEFSVGDQTTAGWVDEIQYRGGGLMCRFGNAWLSSALVKVVDNKPHYPRSLVEPLFKLKTGSDRAKAAIDALKAYKP